jgi:hypothetical protein
MIRSTILAQQPLACNFTTAQWVDAIIAEGHGMMESIEEMLENGTDFSCASYVNVHTSDQSIFSILLIVIASAERTAVILAISAEYFSAPVIV